MRTLVIIPARGGSKGVPGKNIKPLGGKPLILYTLDAAREVADDEHILVSTDSDEIKATVEAAGLSVPFLRSAKLATDNASSYDVILDAISALENKGKHYDTLVLLQPTSPFRTGQHIKEAINLYHSDLDMVVSVKRPKANPYFNLFEENESGFLEKSKGGNYTRRQDCPEVYEYNGAIYVMSIEALKRGPISSFSTVKPYLMTAEDSVDIDTPLDWKVAEYLFGGDK